MATRSTLLTLVTLLTLALLGCSNGEPPADAYGNFEVDEVTISAKVGGELLRFDVVEGTRIDSGTSVGLVDTTDLHLQRAEVRANLSSTAAERKTIEAQLHLAENDVVRLERDAARIRAMYNDKAATQKQLDDITSALESARRNLDVLRSRYPAVNAQADAVRAKSDQLEQRLRDATIINPIKGVVLTKFAEEHEIIAPGRPLYSIANLNDLYLKAFVSGDQLAQITLGQQVTVIADAGQGALAEHTGTISWISDVAEFTPKNVQTRDERVALVYAIKVRVAHQGELKIGMPGEVRWSAAQ